MSKISRKDFVKLVGSAAAGAAAGCLFSGTPALILKKLAALENEGYTLPPQQTSIVTGICSLCPVPCTLSIRLAGENAVSIESSNKSCPLTFTGVQAMAHPERLTSPLKKTREDNFTPVSMNEAITAIAAKLRQLIDTNGYSAISVICSRETVASSKRLGVNIVCEPTPESLSTSVLGGRLAYDFSAADFIISFRSPVFEESIFAGSPKPDKIIYVGSMCTPTASLADEWIPVRPDTEAAFALGMSNYILKKYSRLPNVFNLQQWIISTQNFTVETAAQITGSPVNRIIYAAEMFMQAVAPVAVCPTSFASSADIACVYALNSAVGTNAVSLIQDYGNEISYGLDSFIKNKNFEMLVITNANPVYSSVLGNRLIEKMNRGFTVAVTPFMNDTACYGDYVLPTLLPAELLNLVPPPKDILSVSEIMNRIAEAAGLQQSAPINIKQIEMNRFFFKPESIANIASSANNSDEYPITLLPLTLPLLGTNDASRLPYIIKALDKTYFEDGKLKLQLNEETAAKLELKQGGKVFIHSARGEAGPVFININNAVPPNAAAIPLGFGHAMPTEFAATLGINPKHIMDDAIDVVTGEANRLVTRVRIVG